MMFKVAYVKAVTPVQMQFLQLVAFEERLGHCTKKFLSELELLFSMLQQRTSRSVIMARLNRLLTQSLHKSL